MKKSTKKFLAQRKQNPHEDIIMPEEPRAILVAMSTKKQPIEKTEEFLNELEFLASTANITTIRRFIQRLDRPDSKTLIGKGKLEEISACIDAENIDTIIFDDDLSPSQIKNIENMLGGKKVYDRSLLILDIFLKRAQTAQAKTQVELARYQYLLPRLTNMWTHLERQRGGLGNRGGSGEKQIESDRRIVNDKITLLKEKLAVIEKQGVERRKTRNKIVRVALVGYTNVGKSTIMNLLTKSDVFAENKLFATVDATVRKMTYNRIPFLISDTVGFIRKLPHMLIESFKSTLDEVREADLLLHVVDISHPNFEEHIHVVNTTLGEIGASNKTTIVVFNKIDAYKFNDEEESKFENFEALTNHLKKSYLNNPNDDIVFISAIEKQNIDELRSKILNSVQDKHILIYPNYLKDPDGFEDYLNDGEVY